MTVFIPKNNLQTACYLKAHNHEYRACAKRSTFEKTCEEFQVDRTWRRNVHIYNMQSSGSNRQSRRLSKQHGEQPRDEGEVGKIHGGKRTETCCSLSAILRYCARAPKQPSTVAR